MSVPIRIGQVGIAGYGGSYLKVLLGDAGSSAARLVAAADPFPDRCEKLEEIKVRNVPIYSSLTEMLDNAEIDLAILCTPIHLHAAQVSEALSHGVNILCEKPLAGSLEDAQRMLQASHASKNFVAIGYQWSFSSAVQALKKDILKGDLGKAIRLRTQVAFPRGFDYFARNSWAGRIKTPRGEWVLDSPVNNATSHYLHNMFFVLGDSPSTTLMPQTVQAELYRANAIENYDTAALRCMSASGTEILFYTTHSTPQRTGPKFVFEFEKATVSYDAGNAPQIVAKFRDGHVRTYGNPNDEPHEKLWQSVQAARQGGPILCDVAACMPHMYTVVAAQQSMLQITSFPEGLCTPTALDEETMIVVQGLADTLDLCFERGVLPSELGKAAWAKHGAVIKTADVQATSLNSASHAS